MTLPPEWRNEKPIRHVTPFDILITVVLLIAFWLLAKSVEPTEPELPDHCHPTNWK